MVFDRSTLEQAFTRLGEIAAEAGKRGSALEPDRAFMRKAAIGPGLRVFVATPAYLFAMKCLARRTAGVERTADVDDIRNLAARLGIANAADALSAVTRDYPGGRLPPKTRSGLEEIFGTPSKDR